MKTAIVCEGGGMRGVFTAGALQAFMEAGFMADELIGVSAGASNGVSYVSGQMGRGYRTNVDYAGDKRYASFQSWRHTGSFFGMDFIFGDIAERLDPFDFEAFAASPCSFYAGATDVDTGRATFFSKEHITRGLAVIRASCSMPLLSPMVEYQGHHYLDGGIAAPIPIDKALEDGCDRLIIILTRERAYRKKADSARLLTQLYYRKYPALVHTMALRHLHYNHTLQHIARLEAAGKAIVAAPRAPLSVDRFGKDRDRLIEGYNLGHEAGDFALQQL